MSSGDDSPSANQDVSSAAASPSANDRPAPAPEIGGLFKIASRGVAWSLITSVAVMATSLIAQLVLGWLLTEQDYGVYALALVFRDFLIVFRDGGLNLWLARLRPERFRRIEHQAFWLALACSTATAAALAGVSYFAGRIYGQPQITTFLLILASCFPFSAYGIVASARLQVDLRFKEMALIKLFSALVRYGLVILLAYLGYGPLSFAFAYMAVIAFEFLVYFFVSGIRPWKKSANSQWMRWMFRGSRWSLAGGFSTAILRQCDYAFLGLFAPTAIVGIYFFAYQLAMQPVLLFSESLRRVIIPTFSRGSSDPEHRRRNLFNCGVFLGAVAAPGLLLLSVTAEPLEQILWHGRWASAVRPIQLLVLAMPLHLASWVVEMMAQSRGAFRLWTTSVLVRGLALGAAATVAALLGGKSDPAVFAGIIAVYIAISAVIESVVILRRIGVPIRPLFEGMLPPYICGLLVTAPFVIGWRPGSRGVPILEFLTACAIFAGLLPLTWCLFSRKTFRGVREIANRVLPGRFSI